LKFNIKSVSNLVPQKTAIKGQYFNYLTDNRFSNESIMAFFPKGIFYDDVDFIYSSSPKSGTALSDFHQIHHKLTPIHEGFELQIKIDPAISHLKDKLVIVNEYGSSQGG